MKACHCFMGTNKFCLIAVFLTLVFVYSVTGNTTSKTNWTCDQIPHGILKCSHNSISIQPCACVDYDKFEGLIEVGKCIYTCPYVAPNKAEFADLELVAAVEAFGNSTCAEFNRKGTLCGECKDNFYPLVYSYNLTCVECAGGKSNWWKFVLAAFLPLTAFYFVVLLFRIKITSDIFLYSQFFLLPEVMRLLLFNINIFLSMDLWLHCMECGTLTFFAR